MSNVNKYFVTLKEYRIIQLRELLWLKHHSISQDQNLNC
jgi:hypothetical protein